MVIAKNAKFTKGRRVVRFSGLSKVVSNLKAGKYYVKVRAYRKINGKKVYGPWSKVKKIKIKK